MMFFSGETLQDERTQGGAFVGTDGLQFPHKLIPVSVFPRKLFTLQSNMGVVFKIYLSCPCT